MRYRGREGETKFVSHTKRELSKASQFSCHCPFPCHTQTIETTGHTEIVGTTTGKDFFFFKFLWEKREEVLTKERKGVSENSIPKMLETIRESRPPSRFLFGLFFFYSFILIFIILLKFVYGFSGKITLIIIWIVV